MKIIIIDGVECKIKNEACYNCAYSKVIEESDTDRWNYLNTIREDHKCRLDGNDDSKGICDLWVISADYRNQLNKDVQIFKRT